MKRVHSIFFLFFTGLIIALGFGCKPSAGPGSPPPPGATQFVSVEKNSFNEVTSQLDPGGNFYMYLSTAQWLDGLSGKVSGWQAYFDAMPQIKDEDRANIDKALVVATRLIKDSGIEDATGVGISSIEIEQGLYRNKLLLHHYSGKGQGFFWKIMGGSPHPLNGLNLLPANTALACFSDMDVPLLWSVIKDEAAQSGFPEAQNALQAFPAQFEQQTQVKWNQFLGSLGGEMGLILTLNESNRVSIPVPPAAYQIPEPGLALVLKVNDDTVFNRIDQELKKNQQVVSVDKPGLKMRTMTIPLPLPIDLRPTAASTGGYLIIASSDNLIGEIAAVQHGDKPGLKSTDEFKHLAKDIPDQGNHFSFVSERLGEVVLDVQKQAMASAGANNSSAAQTQWFQNLLTQHQALCTYSVGASTENGYLIVGNGTQSGASLALIPAAAFSGLTSSKPAPPPSKMPASIICARSMPRRTSGRLRTRRPATPCPPWMTSSRT